MEGIENQQIEEQQNLEVTTSEVVETTNEQTVIESTEQITEAPTVSEADIAVKYLKEQGFEIENSDDLQRFKTPQIKEVNPYQDVMDDETINFLEFRKATGKGREEYKMLSIDPESITPIEYAIEKVRNSSGLNLSKEEVLEYLENELGIDDVNELSNIDKIKLANYAKDVKDQRITMYNDLKNIQNKPAAAPIEQVQDELISLDNGIQIKKSDLEARQKAHQQYINANKESVNSVTNSEFKLMLDDNGEQKEVSFTYEFNDQDKHSMLSMTNDTNKLFERYQSENGFNHKQFNEDAFWIDPANRNKAIASIVHKAVAMSNEQVLKGRGNVNLTPHQPIPAQKLDGVKLVSVNDLFRR